jgi:hypothetical protein
MNNRFPVLLAIICTAAAQQVTVPNNGGTRDLSPKRIGVVNMNVIEHSSIAHATLLRVNRTDTSAKLLINVDITNVTKDEIAFQAVGVTFDLTDSISGVRVHETANGCAGHFFSECHTTWLAPPVLAPTSLKISPNSSVKIGPYPIDSEYILSTGKYKVQGYLCYTTANEGSECLKTDQITVTVP